MEHRRLAGGIGLNALANTTPASGAPLGRICPPSTYPESQFLFCMQIANVMGAVQSPKEARTVRTEGGKLFAFKQHRGLTINTTKMAPHEAALQILSFVRDMMVQRDEELTTEETTPLEAKELSWA